jgi:TIR domain
MIDATESLSEVAPTLVQLKKLPLEQKCRLLLARLAKISRHDSSALNKHNLMLPGDPYGLAYGYPETETAAVKEHLLGTPWTKLVNEGFLVDLFGQGFHKVSEEGQEYLDQEKLPTIPSTTPAKLSKSKSGAPRAFLSYSWEGAKPKQWVVKFAERLQGESGVEVTFDSWHLNPGDDRLHFMEQAVAESDFVVVVCTPTYAERANKREGGVGYESTVITSALAERILTNKFIPVLRDGSWSSSLPSFLKTRMGVNLTGEPYQEDEYEKLLRVLHGEPIQPPPLGSKPDFSKKFASPDLKVFSTHLPVRVLSSGFLDPNGLTQSSGISAAVRSYGKQFALEVVRYNERYFAGDHERVDGFGRSYYTTSFTPIVFTLPAGPPWFAVVSLPQEGF